MQHVEKKGGFCSSRSFPASQHHQPEGVIFDLLSPLVQVGNDRSGMVNIIEYPNSSNLVPLKFFKNASRISPSVIKFQGNRMIFHPLHNPFPDPCIHFRRAFCFLKYLLQPGVFLQDLPEYFFDLKLMATEWVSPLYLIERFLDFR